MTVYHACALIVVSILFITLVYREHANKREFKRQLQHAFNQLYFHLEESMRQAEENETLFQRLDGPSTVEEADELVTSKKGDCYER